MFCFISLTHVIWFIDYYIAYCLAHDILIFSYYLSIFVQFDPIRINEHSVLFCFFRICCFFKNMDIVIAYILQEYEKHVFLYVGHVSYKYSVDLFACLFSGGVRFFMSLLPLYHFLGCWEKGVEVSNYSNVVLYFSFELYQFLLYSLPVWYEDIH